MQKKIAKCVKCKENGDQPSFSKLCPIYKEEFAILKLEVEKVSPIS